MDRGEVEWTGGRSDGEVTILLRRMSEGDSDASSEVYQLLYEDLKQRARGLMRRERSDHTLQATMLIGAAYERIQRLLGKEWADRGHFLRYAARVMRCVLIDHARSRQAKADFESSPLDEVVIEVEDRVIDLLAFDESLRKLEEIDPEMAKVAEMRSMGFGVSETAAVVGIPERTLRYRWPAVRAFLFRCIHES